MVKTLYNICLENLILNSAHVVDLSGVPFEPYLLDLLNYLFIHNNTWLEERIHQCQQQKRWKNVCIANLLGRIGEAHGSVLRQHKYTYYGSLHLHIPDDSKYMVDKLSPVISPIGGAPQFITQLDLSMSWFGDDDIHNLKFMVNLRVLDLSATKITDYGVTHLSRLTQLDNNTNNNSRVGFRYLETLSLAYNQNITDGSLKPLSKMTTLCGIDLSTTNVIRQIATTHLKKYNYIYNDTLPPPTVRRTSTLATKAWHGKDDIFFRRLICKAYDQDQRDEMCPAHSLSLITHQVPPYPYPNEDDDDNNNSNNNNNTNNHQYKEERKYCTMTPNKLLYLFLTNDISYGHFHSYYDTKMRLWWTKGNGQYQPLVFTRPPLEPIKSTESMVGKKRSSDNAGDATAAINKAPQLRSLTVKQSQAASSFIENFQW